MITDDDVKRAALLLAEHEALIRDLRALGGDDHGTLQRVARYLSATDVPRELTAPLVRLMGRMMDEKIRGDGKPRKAINSALALTLCAAAVTVLHERGSAIPDAIRLVAGAAPKFGKPMIKAWRYDVMGGKKPEYLKFYDEMTRDLRCTDDAEIFDRIKSVAYLGNTPSVLPK